MEVVTLWLAVDDSDPENGCAPPRPTSAARRESSKKPNGCHSRKLQVAGCHRHSCKLQVWRSLGLLPSLALIATVRCFRLPGMRVLPGTHTMELHEMVPSHKESVLGSQMNPELVDDTGAVHMPVPSAILCSTLRFADVHVGRSTLC